MRFRSILLIAAVLVVGGLGLAAMLSDEESGLGNVPTLPGGGREIETGGEQESGAISPVGDWLYVRRFADEALARENAYRRALDAAAGILERTVTIAPELAAASWAHIGPARIGGRVADVAVDPTTPDTAYAATGSGGIWRSGDGGLTWQRSWPSDFPQATAAIAVAGDGTVYVGTGEPTPAGGYVVSGGRGVYRSTDGGGTWETIGLTGSGSIGRIAVDPTDPDRVYVAAMGPLLRAGGERGLFRTTDGGRSWERLLTGITDTAGAIDVAVGADGRTVVAAMWDRDVPGRSLAGPGSGVYASRDGGETWRAARFPGIGAPGGVGRIGVALAPADPKRAYAVAISRNGGALGVWRSSDGGGTWVRTAADPGALLQQGYGWWFGRVWVDLRDPERVFVAGALLLESVDAAETFAVQGGAGGPGLPISGETGVHLNQHAMAWDPVRAGRVYLGTDGGMYRSNGGAHDGTWVAARSQGWTQHYSVAGTSWTASEPRRVDPAPATDENPLGAVTAIDAAPSDADVLYAGNAEGSVFRTGDGGQTWVQLADPGFTGGDDPAQVTHVVVDRDDPDVAVAVFAPTGAEGSMVAITRDGGAGWTNLTSGLPGAPVNDAVLLPGGELVVASDVGVFLRRDAGWVAVGANLPRVPVLDLRYQADVRALTAATFGHGILRVVLA